MEDWDSLRSCCCHPWDGPMDSFCTVPSAILLKKVDWQLTGSSLLVLHLIWIGLIKCGKQRSFRCRPDLVFNCDARRVRLWYLGMWEQHNAQLWATSKAFICKFLFHDQLQGMFPLGIWALFLWSQSSRSGVVASFGSWGMVPEHMGICHSTLHTVPCGFALSAGRLSSSEDSGFIDSTWQKQ